MKNTCTFECSYDLAYNIEKFASELSDMMSEAKGFELREIEPALVHLAAFRNAMVEIEAKVLARQELERLEELAERDTYDFETVDGEKVTFDAPNGFEVRPQQPIYSGDLWQLQIVDGKIVAARDAFRHAELNKEELDKCNSEFRLVKG